MLHGAETAFTKISPFKIKEVVEEEGSNSPFAVLSNKDDSTRMLTTILLTTTSLSIYSTALFVGTVSRLFPQLSLGTVTAALTSITLLFGEILPKALAVSNPEVVVRRVASPINYLATVLQPITATVTFLSKLFLGLLGLELVDDKAVSEDMLRMMVVEAQRDPTTGIESGEGRMIEGVLDLQKQTVDKIMCPRIDMLALPTETSATELLRIAIREQFSRIPIYAGDIDNIKGIVIIRDLLNFISLPEEGDAAGTALLPAAWERLTAEDLMVPTYYIPETMSTYSAMEELRRRSKHMAIVVDEYGGTAGVVTFEDILEEVVGEIYDESDTAEEEHDLQTISRDSAGAFTIAGNADLDDVAEALGMELDEEVVGETSTIGGLLSKQTGCIPELDARLVCGGYYFTVIGRDERRILSVTAEAAADLEDGWEGDWGDYKLAQESLVEHQGDLKSGKKEDSKGGGVAHGGGGGGGGGVGGGVGGVEGVDGLDVDVPEGTTLSFRDGEWVDSSGNGHGNGLGNTSASASTNVK
jgi:CBS domain containing-hemolysin-like protein